MIIGINQPYYLPYLGLFDRINFCDKFIINPYSKLNRERSYHRRVRIIQLHPDAKSDFLYLTENIPSKYEGIPFSDVKLDSKFWEVQKIHVETLIRTYKNAPYYAYVKDIFNILLDSNIDNLGEYNYKLIFFIASKLGLESKLINLAETGINKSTLIAEVSSELTTPANYYNLFVCKYFKAEGMIAGQNAPLWLDESLFTHHGVRIWYQKVKFAVYRQYSSKNVFIPGLSALDLLFNCGESSQTLVGKGSVVVDRSTLIANTVLTGR